MPDKIIEDSTSVFIDSNALYTPEGAEFRWHLAIAGLYGILPGGAINSLEIEESYFVSGLEPHETKKRKRDKAFKKWQGEAFEEAFKKYIAALLDIINRYITHLNELEKFLDAEIENLKNADGQAAQDLRADLIDAKARVAEQRDILEEQSRQLSSPTITQARAENIQRTVEQTTTRIQTFRNWITGLFARRTSNNTTQVIAAVANARLAETDRQMRPDEIHELNFNKLFARADDDEEESQNRNQTEERTNEPE